MRRARSALALPCTRCSISSGDRRPFPIARSRPTISAMPDIACVARAFGRQGIAWTRDFERAAMGFEHDHRRIALPAFDLREIPLGNPRIARRAVGG